MARSRFDAIIKHREWIEDKEKRELAEIGRSLEKEKDTLESWNQLQKDSLKSLREKQEKGTTASEVMLYSSFLNGLSTRIEKQKGIIEKERIRFDQKLDDLAEASKKKKIVMKIKEKELQRLRIEQLQKEQRFMDEIGINKFARDTAE